MLLIVMHHGMHVSKVCLVLNTMKLVVLRTVKVDQAEHAVGRRVLRAEVEREVLVLTAELALANREARERCPHCGEVGAAVSLGARR